MVTMAAGTQRDDFARAASAGRVSRAPAGTNPQEGTMRAHLRRLPHSLDANFARARGSAAGVIVVALAVAAGCAHEPLPSSTVHTTAAPAPVAQPSRTPGAEAPQTGLRDRAPDGAPVPNEAIPSPATPATPATPGLDETLRPGGQYDPGTTSGTRKGTWREGDPRVQPPDPRP